MSDDAKFAVVFILAISFVYSIAYMHVTMGKVSVHQTTSSASTEASVAPSELSTEQKVERGRAMLMDQSITKAGSVVHAEEMEPIVIYRVLLDENGGIYNVQAHIPYAHILQNLLIHPHILRGISRVTPPPPMEEMDQYTKELYLAVTRQ